LGSWLGPELISEGRNLILMGRSREPSGEPDWLVGLDGEAEIKRAIVAQVGLSISPQKAEAEFNRIQASREIRRNLARISAAGSEVRELAVPHTRKMGWNFGS